mmetsp:Transcript_40660/g.65977  ORF Transcript_40660/g.65977 Transcript_40660/m.65977 type:complete len:155 (-) Transcript_40660:694-1158(-)
MPYWRCICGQTLMYPTGAPSFQCPSCLATTIPQPGSVWSRMNCSGCGIPLAFPSGCPAVTCSICSVVTPIGQIASPPTAQIVCSGCSKRLMYPAGAREVQCSICNAITSAQEPTKPREVVIVQNPGDETDVEVGVAVAAALPASPNSGHAQRRA